MSRSRRFRPDNELMESFLELSAALTGFSRVDLLGTGVARQYFRTVHAAEEDRSVALLERWRHVQESSDEIDAALRYEILSDPDLGPVARNLIQMWYLGQWPGNAESTVSAEAYTQGLVWDAIGAHTQGAKQQGFGVWSLRPDVFTEERDQ